MRNTLGMDMYGLCLALSRSDRVIRVLIARELESFDLTMMEWLALAAVEDAPAKGIAMSGVAKALDVTLPQITALANRLVEKKLVKQSVNKRDRRSRSLIISRGGRKVIEDIDNAVNTKMKGLLGDIPADHLHGYVQTAQSIAAQKATLI